MGVPAVDPNATSRRLRASVRFARSPFGRWFGINVSSRIDPFLLRVSGGRVSSFAGAPIVNVTVRGRRSGAPRSSALLYFTQGTDVVLIASSFGREKHPAWYLNMKADPDVELEAKGRTGRYVAREAEGAERDRLYAQANLIYPGYDDYERRAAAAGRTIPVMVLSPA